MRELAWIVHQEKVYWAWSDQQSGQAHSCVTILIQEIFHRFKDLSFFILRERIYTTRSITEMDKGMVLLAAKRISDQLSETEFPKHLESINLNENSSRLWLENYEKTNLIHQFDFRITDDKQAFDFLNQMITQIPRGEVLHDYNRKIAALVVDEDGRPRVAATNFNYLNKTLHAEIRCLQFLSHQNIRLEHGAKLYVSLKPCRMCAGMLSELARPNDVEVIYFENDPGKLAQGSSFEKLGRFRLVIDSMISA